MSDDIRDAVRVSEASVLIEPRAATGGPAGFRISVDVERPRLLYVGADEDTRRRLVNTLGGLELVFASNAYEAICRINARAFDLYILEQWVPNWSGLSLCRDIRKDDPHVPLCLLTSSRRNETGRARRAGVNMCLSKPLDERLLEEYVCTLVEIAMGRNEGAWHAAFTGARDEIQRRRALLGDALFSQRFEAALGRVARNKALEAFLSSGGTMISFQRSWDHVWRAACADASSSGLKAVQVTGSVGAPTRRAATS